MGEWPCVQLREVTTKIGSGATPRGGGAVYTEVGTAFIRSQNIRDGFFSFDGLARISDDAALQLSNVEVEAPDVLICITGESVTRTAMPDPSALPARVSQHVAIIRPDRRRVDPRFLMYTLLAPAMKSRLSALSQAGATRRALTKAHLEGLDLPLPSLTEQRAIAEVLGALDDKIAANDRTARIAVDLMDALHARAVADARTQAVPLFDELDVVFGEAFKGAHFTPPGTGRPLIRIRDLKTHAPQVWTTEQRASETVVHEGDVVVGMDAEFRSSWWLGEPGLLNQRTFLARSRSGGRAFAALALRRPLAALEGEKSATTVIHLNKSDLARSTVDLPDRAVLAEFDAKAEPLLRSRLALARESLRLAATRDELLPLLMDGRIRIRDAEKKIKEVI